MIASGLGTAEIAAALFVSPHTVRDDVKAIFEKVDVSSRGELTAKLFAEHYVQPLRRGAYHVDGELRERCGIGMAPARPRLTEGMSADRGHEGRRPSDVLADLDQALVVLSPDGPAACEQRFIDAFRAGPG